MRGLYAIVDVSTLGARGVDVLEFARAVVRGGPSLVQLRAKDASARDTLALLRSVGAVCSERGIPLFANDRPDLARIAGCAGVHVGQDDLSIEDVRRFAPGLRVGVSTHDLEQLSAALSAAPDYVAFGPVFPTTSKARPEPVVGVEALAEAARLARGRAPLVAIGGIDLSRAPAVARHADLGAVIGALLPPEGLEAVTERVRVLHDALSGFWE